MRNVLDLLVYLLEWGLVSVVVVLSGYLLLLAIGLPVLLDSGRILLLILVVWLGLTWGIDCFVCGGWRKTRHSRTNSSQARSDVQHIADTTIAHMRYRSDALLDYIERETRR